MSKISFFKKISLFSEYKKALKNNKAELENQFGVRIDKAHRLYTVINIPKELIGEAYSLKKSDIDTISETYIKEFGIGLSVYLNSIGLTELFKSYEISKVAKYSYLIVVGFSLINTKNLYNNIYYKLIPTLVILTILSIILYMF